jgi:hypothetical protein
MEDRERGRGNTRGRGEERGGAGGIEKEEREVLWGGGLALKGPDERGCMGGVVGGRESLLGFRV